MSIKTRVVLKLIRNQLVLQRNVLIPYQNISVNQTSNENTGYGIKLLIKENYVVKKAESINRTTTVFTYIVERLDRCTFYIKPILMCFSVHF